MYWDAIEFQTDTELWHVSSGAFRMKTTYFNDMINVHNI